MSLTFRRRLHRPTEPESDSLEAQFWEFHEQNPHVAEELARLALQLKRRGVDRYGIAALYEVLRYEKALQTDGDEFKLNNNYKALYSRYLMKAYPQLKGFFETRRRTAV